MLFKNTFLFPQKHHGSFSQIVLVSNFNYVIPVYLFLNNRGDKAFQGLKQGKDYKLPIILFLHKEKGGELLWYIFLSIKGHYSWKLSRGLNKPKQQSLDKHFKSKLHDSLNILEQINLRGIRNGNIYFLAQAVKYSWLQSYERASSSWKQPPPNKRHELEAAQGHSAAPSHLDTWASLLISSKFFPGEKE